ncbi:MAG: putative metallopeptidase [Planctomycetaceae bacterium]
MHSSAHFDFTHAMRLLCCDIAARMDEFAHVRMDQIAVTFAQTRSRVSHGLQAKLTPLRFEQGAMTTTRKGRKWTVQRLFVDEREMLYILTFYLPRFLDQTFREKMITVVHELYHISPRFDGDIRRMEGRYHVHSHSQKEFDRQMGMMVDEYLADCPPREMYDFLEDRFRTLVTRHGRILGMKVAIPKLIPVPESKSA